MSNKLRDILFDARAHLATQHRDECDCEGCVIVRRIDTALAEPEQTPSDNAYWRAHWFEQYKNTLDLWQKAHRKLIDAGISYEE